MPEDFDLGDVTVIETHCVLIVPVQTTDPEVTIMYPVAICLN